MHTRNGKQQRRVKNKTLGQPSALLVTKNQEFENPETESVLSYRKTKESL